MKRTVFKKKMGGEGLTGKRNLERGSRMEANVWLSTRFLAFFAIE